MSRGPRLRPSQIRVIMREATRSHATGELLALAEQCGIKSNSFSALVMRTRQGHIPAYWNEVLKESFDE